MNILLVGGNTTNKGAYLMLLAAKDLASKKFPNADFILPPSVAGKDILREEGFSFLDYPLFHVGTGNRLFSLAIKYPFITKLLLKYGKGRSLVGDISLKDINLVLDVSGFAFGDKFGLTPLLNLKKQVNFFKKRNIPYIILPQALGPFSGNNKKAAYAAFKNIDLIFARDKISYQNLINLELPLDKCQQSSDITLSLSTKKKLPERFLAIKPYGTIVPNIRMLDKADESWKKNYENALINCVNIILSKSSRNILILVHSTTLGGDADLADRIYNNFSGNDRVYLDTDENPLVLKKILKDSDFLIGSRFHALASALSSSTPSIGTSWLHKYEMLFEEYGIKEYSFANYNSNFEAKVGKLVESNNLLSSIENRLEKKNVLLQETNSKLWDLISNKLS